MYSDTVRNGDSARSSPGILDYAISRAFDGTVYSKVYNSTFAGVHIMEFMFVGIWS